jgi:FAD/FMN-containing dehydrogenase
MSEPAVDRRTFLAGGAGLLLAGAGVAAGPTATAFARRRAPGLQAGLRQAVHGPVLTPGQAGFRAAAHVYNERFDSVLPEAVARPLSGADVQRAVQWAIAHGVRVRARSGGHSYAGYSTLEDGVVLDLRKLNQIHVDRGAGTATVGAGAQLIDVYTGLARSGATIPAGSCPSVGVSGVTLGGGMGLAGRAFGLTTDHVKAVKIVTADGRLRTVDSRTDPDLLWALRGGGGGNFGVVTEFTFRVRPLPSSASYFFVSWPWSSAAEALVAWMGWAPHANQNLTSIFGYRVAGGNPNVSVSGQFLGAQSQLQSLLAPILKVPGAALSTGSEAYLPLQMRWAGCSQITEAACHTVGAAPGGTLARASFAAKSDYVARPISEQGAAALAAAVASRGNQPGSGAVLFDSYGGAINQVSPTATAFVHREQLCAIQYLSYGGGGQWLQRTWQTMRPHVSGQAYQNYIDPGLNNWQAAYYAGNYKRLVATQREYDPHKFFSFPQAIGR